MTVYHPQRNDQQQRVCIAHPHTPTEPAAFSDAQRIATVVPNGSVPERLHGIALTHWSSVPQRPDAWQALADQNRFDEPPLPALPKGFKQASGVIIIEPDERIWLVSPTNRFAGYTTTFPKGSQDAGLSLTATAIKEAYEESGLQVRLTGYFADCARSASMTRYYLAERIGGNPADMGWESQAVHLVPRRLLHELLDNPYDQDLCRCLQENASKAPKNL